jgi:small subunit ribosomal protein S20
MPITKSAKKAIRNSNKKRIFNVRRKKGIEDTVKDIKKLLKEKKVDEAKKLIPKAYQAIDKAAKGNTISKGTASRRKSRLVAMVKRVK